MSMQLQSPAGGACQHDHLVLFYEDGAFPESTVADYLWEGLRAGESALTAATAANNLAIRERLATLGAEVGELERDGRLLMLDAHQTLRKFMGESMPDRERFFAVIGGAIDASTRAAPARACRAFGEMVGVLVDAGNVDAAVELERQWNELLAGRDCGLYCAYPMRQFAHASLAEPFLRICNEHGQVLPVPTGQGPHEGHDGHGRCVASLQQQARALQADVAERLYAEEQLRRHRDHLEELVRERTEQLHIAKNKAEVANRAKSAFLSNMSHELRTPLNAILGYAQLLRREPGVSERVGARLGIMQQSGQHLLTLINDLLDLAKIEAGKVELDTAPLDLGRFLDSVADIIRIKVEERSLLLDYRPEPALPRAVVADEKRLRQLLLNLLANAVKFTDRGQVGLAVTLVDAGPDVARLRFEVSDTGVGIAPEQLRAIFLPFEQVGDIERRGTGTGLGLAISLQLARLMGGEIHVESELGKGSRFGFELSLPLSRAALPAEPERRSMVGYEGPRRAVLIADDLVNNRALLTDLLDGMGFAVSEASNGLEAMERIQARRPDLAILDLVMPVLAGFQTIGRLRRMAEFDDLPIVAVSASAHAEDAQASLQAGANAFLMKPLDTDALLQRVGELMGLTWRYADPVPGAPQPAGPMLPPPADSLAALRQLALIGNLRDVRQFAAGLVELDERYRPFAAHLQHLAQSYQSKALLAFVDGYTAPTPPQSGAGGSA